MQLPDIRMPSRAELRALPDSALLAQLRRLPRDSTGREAICEILVSRYTGLVRSCVRPYLQSPEPTEDLLQVGYVGLLKAINNFDPDCGDSLAAYAQPCISGEIKRHFRDRRWQLRVRRHDQELLLEMPEDAPEPEALRALRELDPDAMKPKAALDALYALKRTL